MSGYGVIQEQGDLGLGFNEVSEEEQKALKEHMEQQQKDAAKNSDIYH